MAQANVLVAAGVQVLTITAAVAEEGQESLVVLFDVAETFSIDNGETPVDTSGDLAALAQAQAENCNP